MAADAGKGAATLSKARLKPEIYTTANGKTLVEDELLNFLVVKMKTLSQEDIILLTVNHFGSEWIENSKKALFDLCPNTTQRFVTHKGPQKDANNVKSCLKVLNEAGENIPRFVSHNLDELPPITYNSIDVSCMLRTLERVSADISSLKQAVSEQTGHSDDLRSIAIGLNQRLCAVEKCGTPAKNAALPPGRDEEAANPGVDDARRVPVGTEPTVIEPGRTPGVIMDPAVNTAVGNAIHLPILPASPPYSSVVKKGRQRQHLADKVTSQPRHKPRLNSTRREKKSGVVGTGVCGSIRVVKTKLVSVFASRFSPDVDSEELTCYLKGKLQRDVTCQKIDSVQKRYNSFKITAECAKVEEMYEPELWPEGIFVRRFFEARKTVDLKTLGVARSNDNVSEAGASAAVKVGLLP